jgi:hypothetical protein
MRPMPMLIRTALALVVNRDVNSDMNSDMNSDINRDVGICKFILLNSVTTSRLIKADITQERAVMLLRRSIAMRWY